MLGYLLEHLLSYLDLDLVIGHPLHRRMPCPVLMIPPTAEVDDYLAALPAERQAALLRIRDGILQHLPDGFVECFDGMPSYVVPLSRFPAGYHCKPDTPLPFLSFASQKNFIALYHFGIYVDRELDEWFRAQWQERVKTRLDMGKSCIRFRKLDQLPFDLIDELVSQRSPEQWIASYEAQRRRA